MNLATSTKGIDLIKGFESLRLQVYKDQGGRDTIGYGHLLTEKEIGTVVYISEQGALSYLRSDLKEDERVVNNSVKKPLNQNQFDALVSLVFNIGSGHFGVSTILKLINKNPYDLGIFSQFLIWNHVKGVVSNGLTARRHKEAELYFSKSL